MTIFQMKQAQAKADLAKIDLQDTTVVAPFDGVVANRQVQVGKYVKATANMLSLVDLKNIWLIANFKETQLSDLQLNQEVEIKIDGFKDLTFLGKIDSISAGSGASFTHAGNYCRYLWPPRHTGRSLRHREQYRSLRAGKTLHARLPRQLDAGHCRAP